MEVTWCVPQEVKLLELGKCNLNCKFERSIIDAADQTCIDITVQDNFQSLNNGQHLIFQFSLEVIVDLKLNSLKHFQD